MSSGLKPILSQVTQQGPPTYGQPSTHVPQNLASMQHGLPTPAHNSSTQNHYLNVPNTTYNAAMSIPASNHPIPNITQSTSVYVSPPKQQQQYPASYQQGHQVMHQPQPALPQQPQATVPQPQEPQEKPHSNGTSEIQGSQSGEQQSYMIPSQQQQQQQQQIHQQQHQQIQQQQQQLKDVVEKSNTKENKPTTPVSNLTDESSNETKQPEENVPDVIDSSSSASIEGIEITTSNSSTAETKPEEAEVPSESANVTEVIAKATIEPVMTIDSAQGATVTTENNASMAMSMQPNKEQTLKSNVKQPPPTAAPSTRTAGQSKKSKAVKAETATIPGDGTTQKMISAKPDKPLLAMKTSRVKRSRKKVQPYQYPIPELEIISKMTNTTKATKKDNDENLIIFYKNEFLAVRSHEGGFYICQAVQNIYKRSTKINIRWLSQDLEDKSGEVYIPDFYDVTDVDCILTNLELTRVDKVKFRLPPKEKNRTDSILRRALAVEKGEAVPPSPTEEHPDGLDLSLYKEESQLQKSKAKVAVRKPTAAKPSRSRQRSPGKAKKRIENRVEKVVSARPKPKEPVHKKEAVKRRAPGSGTTATAAVSVTTALDGKKSAMSSAAMSRSERAKRRHENSGVADIKERPVIDAKKARVLAKVVKKVATKETVSRKPDKKEIKPPVTTKAGSKALSATAKKTKQNQAAPLEQRKTKRTRK